MVQDNQFMQNTQLGGFCCGVSVECNDQRNMEMPGGGFIIMGANYDDGFGW